MFGRGYRKRTQELLDRQWEENRKEWKQSFERTKQATEPGRWIDAYPLASMGVATVAGAVAGSKLAADRNARPDSPPAVDPQESQADDDGSDSGSWTRTVAAFALPWVRNWIMDQLAAFETVEGAEQADAASAAIEEVPPTV